VLTDIRALAHHFLIAFPNINNDAVLPWEIKTGSRRLSFQDQLAADDYATLMKDELDDLAGHRLKSFISIEENKKRVARWYDKKVKAKEFADGDLVWKLILPIGIKSSKFGKWSPNWEGPYRINRSCSWKCLYFGNSRRD